MKPTNQVTKKHNLGDKSSQSQKPGPAKGAAQSVCTPAGKTRTIGVWVPRKTYKQVAIMAKAVGLSMAAIVRLAIYDKMKRLGDPWALSVLGITARRLAKPAVAARIRALTESPNQRTPARAEAVKTAWLSGGTGVEIASMRAKT